LIATLIADRGPIAGVTESLTVRVDPHVHSKASYDATDPVELILEQAAEIGLDAVVVTDHDVVHESLRAAELAPEYGLVGIPGVEVSTADGHLLAIGVDEMPPRRRPLNETVAWIREHGGVAIVPHPFQRSRHGVRKRRLAQCHVDAVEVYNSWLFTGYKNRRARRFADRHGYPGIGGSDAHHVPSIGRAFTEITIEGIEREELTADVILGAIREGDTAVQGRRQPIPVSAHHYGVGAARKSGCYAKAGALRSAYYAKTAGLRSAYYAKTAGVRGVAGTFQTMQALYRRTPLSR
jgi:predicted metal-dependent phosphoesterase TrpH